MAADDENNITHHKVGACFDVALTHRVAKEFQKAEVRARAALGRHMEKLADNGMQTLMSLQVLKFEQRIDVSGLVVAVYALRDRTTRLYGGPITRQPLPLFLMTEISTKKHGEGKADQECLKRAARYLAEVIGALGSKGGRR